MIRFLTGLVAGLAIAYLTAPQPGKHTRDRLAGFVQDEVEGVNIIKNTVARVEDAFE